MSDDDIRPRWQRLILNRFVMVPLALAVIAGAWNLYVVTHNGGVVTGMVVDAQGRPVEGAAITIWTFNFTTFSETGRTTTGSDGHFTFTGNASHNIQISAAKPGVGTAARVPLRLYFRAQDAALREPLRLSGGA